MYFYMYFFMYMYLDHGREALNLVQFINNLIYCIFISIIFHFVFHEWHCVFTTSSVRIPLVQLQKVAADITQILSLTFGTMHT